MKKLKIKIFRNANSDYSLESKVNDFLESSTIDVQKINYLATSNVGSISVIIEYKDK